MLRKPAHVSSVILCALGLVLIAGNIVWSLMVPKGSILPSFVLGLVGGGLFGWNVSAAHRWFRPNYRTKWEREFDKVMAEFDASMAAYKARIAQRPDDE